MSAGFWEPSLARWKVLRCYLLVLIIARCDVFLSSLLFLVFFFSAVLEVVFKFVPPANAMFVQTASFREASLGLDVLALELICVLSFYAFLSLLGFRYLSSKC